MRIAVDVHVSDRDKKCLTQLGFKIINAFHGEKDAEFFRRSDDYLPEIYISHDGDWRDHAQAVGAAFYRPQKDFLSKLLNVAIDRSKSPACLDPLPLRE